MILENYLIFVGIYFIEVGYYLFLIKEVFCLMDNFKKIVLNWLLGMIVYGWLCFGKIIVLKFVLENLLYFMNVFILIFIVNSNLYKFLNEGKFYVDFFYDFDFLFIVRR